MELKEFLTWLLSAGGASACASFILERIPKFQALSSEVKQWVFFFTCAFLSVSSYSIVVYVPPEILEQVAPFFGLVASVFVSTFFGTAFHRLDKKISQKS